MDTAEARSILERELGGYRLFPYDELRRLVGETMAIERLGGSGAAYQVEITVMWDDRTGGTVRVVGSIDDGGWRSLFPVTSSFLVSADGTFPGE